LQLIDILGGVVERPVVISEFDHNYLEIVRMMDEELAAVKQIYDEGMEQLNTTGSLYVHTNMPQMSGQLQWINELRGRTLQLMDQFKRIDHPLVSNQ
jgi:Dynein heavy chain, N-terminal region 1